MYVNHVSGTCRPAEGVRSPGGKGDYETWLLETHTGPLRKAANALSTKSSLYIQQVSFSFISNYCQFTR